MSLSIWNKGIRADPLPSAKVRDSDDYILADRYLGEEESVAVAGRMVIDISFSPLGEIQSPQDQPLSGLPEEFIDLTSTTMALQGTGDHRRFGGRF